MLGTLWYQFGATFITKYSSRSLTLQSYFVFPPYSIKFSKRIHAWPHPFYTMPSCLNQHASCTILYIVNHAQVILHCILVLCRNLRTQCASVNTLYMDLYPHMHVAAQPQL